MRIIAGFEKKSYTQLEQIENRALLNAVAPLLIPGEQSFGVFSCSEEEVIFTNKRVMVVVALEQGEKHRGYYSLPYSDLRTYALETSDLQKPEAVLELLFSHFGPVKFEFVCKSPIMPLCQIISSYILR